MKLFDSFKEWWKYLYSAIKKVFVGIVRILYAIVIGFVSLLVGLFRSIKKCWKGEKLNIFLSLLVAAVILAWAMTFANERAMRVGAEMQRDSLAFVISRMGMKCE